MSRWRRGGTNGRGWGGGGGERDDREEKVRESERERECRINVVHRLFYILSNVKRSSALEIIPIYSLELIMMRCTH